LRRHSLRRREYDANKVGPWRAATPTSMAPIARHDFNSDSFRSSRSAVASATDCRARRVTCRSLWQLASLLTDAARRTAHSLICAAINVFQISARVSRTCEQTNNAANCPSESAAVMAPIIRLRPNASVTALFETVYTKDDGELVLPSSAPRV
jgi:hypothetical protein